MSQEDLREAADLTAPKSASLGQSKETIALSPEDRIDGQDDPLQDASVQPGGSASHRADAKSEEEKDPQKTSGQPIEDNVSIADSDIREFRSNAWGPGTYKESEIEKFQKDSGKYARVAGIYVEGLKARVCALESELHKMQIQMGVKKREDNVIQHPPSNEPCFEPCSEHLPCKAVRLSTKDMREWGPKEIWKEASILLGFETSPTALNSDLVRPSTLHGPQISPLIEDSGIRRPGGMSVDGIQSGPTELARIICLSPWVSIVLEVLTSQTVNRFEMWVYPFKHIIVYEKQIRKFVALLSEVELERFQAKDLLGTLKRIIQQIPLDLDPTRDEHEYSDINIETTLWNWRFYFKGHLEKAKRALSKNQEETSLVENRDNELVGSSHLFSPMKHEGVDGENQDHGGTSDPAEHNLPDLTCTCLKDAKDQLQLLASVIDEYMTPLLTLRNSISERSLKKIKFRDLWLLYQPGDLVISSKTSKSPLQAYRVVHVCGGRPLMTKSLISSGEELSIHQDEDRRSGISPFKIDCVNIDFDGETFGPVQRTIEIMAFDDERQITELDVYPIEFSEHHSVLRDTLSKRGEHFATYREFKHKRYSGLSLGDIREEIESEVIIDFEQAFRQRGYHKYAPQLGIQGNSFADVRELYDDVCSTSKCLQEDHNCILDDTQFDIFRKDKFVNAASSGLLQKTHQSTQNLSEDQLILLPYCIHGFSLRNRKWVALNIDSIMEVQDDESLDGKNVGFNDLVIPEEYKKTIKALVKSHAIDSKDPNSHQVDLIRSKGKGLVILLHGVPGVGKTSTAESVAAFTGRPLFPITCGDIGQTAYDVERQLEGIFLLAQKWGCILLLDEADVFLEKRERSGSSIERNALVSVFLRTLEYYSGILFLTTNRIGSFDEAFISRIHMSLYYADLDQDSTFKVWTMNLDRIKRSGRNIYIDDEQIRAFARNHWRDGHRWNGRQIRNAFSTALALAEYDFHEKCKMCDEIGEKPPLKPALLADQFKAVAQTSAEFDNYLYNVYGGSTYKDKAKVAEIRNDEWQDRGLDTPTGKKYSAERAVRPSASLGRGVSSG